ncbi:MAG: carboxypeptidase regulatory-like domain-containing protein [Acidobacteriota bacterium]
MVSIHSWLVVFTIGAFNLTPVAAPAQTQPALAVTGVAVDQAGGVLPGVPLELVDGSGAVAATTTSDNAGAFRFDHVPPGAYDLRGTLEGFTAPSVRVRVGSRAPDVQKLVFQVSAVAQEVTVNANTNLVTTAAAANADAIVLDPKTLDSLPVFDNDVIAAASRFLDPAAVGTAGATLIVDGLEVSSAGVPSGAIDQIKISQDPYASEYARPGRGRIEVTTKPGGQAFHGTARTVFRDARLNSREPFAATRAPEQRRIFEGVLGGPVLNGKTTSFLLTVEQRAEDVQAVVFAVDPSGAAVRANVPTPQRSLQGSASINRQLGTHNTLSLRFTHEGGSNHNQGVGGTVLPEAGSDSRATENQLVYGQRTIVGKRMLNELRVVVGLERQTTSSLNAAPRVVVLDAFTAGGAQADSVRTQRRVGATEAVTYLAGHHLIKAGFNIPEWNRRGNDDFTNSGGTFSFSTLQDYALGTPFSFVQQRGDGRLAFVDKNFGAFVQDQFAITSHLSTALGLRYDWQNHVGDHNNLAPRASLAYSPGTARRVVIRGGAGIFYDRLEGGPISDLLHADTGLLTRYVVQNPSYPDPSAGGTLAVTPPSTVRLSPAAVIPSTLQYGVGIEKQVRKSTTLAVNYVGSRVNTAFRSIDTNAPAPPFYAIRPNSALGVVREISSTARQRNQSVQFTLRGHLTSLFEGTVQYALASAKNDTGGVNSLPANNYDLASEWGRADFDQRHRFDLLGVFAVSEHAQIGAALALSSGRPYSLRTGRDDFNTGQGTARPLGVARNTLEGPGYADLDVRWSQDIPLQKGSPKGPAATIGIDAFNVLNRVNFSSYVGNQSSPFFGRALSAQPPRRVQISARFKF